VRLLKDGIEIEVAIGALGDLLKIPAAPDAPAHITLTSALRLTRTGRTVRLIQNDGTTRDAQPDATLVKLVAKARSWWNDLRTGELDIPALAKREGVTASYVTRIIRLAFLAPGVVEALLTGSQRATVSSTTLTTPGGIPLAWTEQGATFQPGPLI
jgi:hypothetical protein